MTEKHEPKFHVDLTFDVYINDGGGGAIIQAEAIDSLLTADPYAAAKWISDNVSLSDYKSSTEGSGDETKIFMDWGGVTVRVSIENEDFESDDVDAKYFAKRVHGYLVELGLKVS